jgi:succinate dehydrogenase (ubiquinone) cytochrome b560 subunit
MKRTGRPVSPHVTIYAFPVTALSSITNRVTGCALSFGCFGLATIDLVGGGSGSALSVMQSIGDTSWVLASTAKLTVAFPIAYHYLGGIRHLMWDMSPDLLTNVDAQTSSYYLLGASTVLSLGALCV